jgi:hypothetical protein
LQLLARLTSEAGYCLIESRVDGRVGAKWLSRRAIGGIVLDKTLLAGEGRNGALAPAEAQARPWRGREEEHALLTGIKVKGIGEALLVQAQPAAFGDENEAGSIGGLAFEEGKRPQFMPGKKPGVGRIPKAMGIQYFGFDNQCGLTGARGGL